MNSQSELSLVKKLTAIASFLPAFQEGKDLSSLAQFVAAAYANNWVSSDINWVEWMKTDEAKKLRDNPTALAKASEHDLACLLTTLIRQERFCEGSLEGAYDSGLLTRILQRAASMLDEMTSKGN
ncbi:DUF6508 domain-containing protein [Planktothrix agardhii 1806]|uniref:DUF6508 domain-containing protein n=1 Tax=Planktothrix agardhii TaxID=1160 RepID=UPI001D0BA159|nr:DUF6508 domain-containing protein [Planktothrix agardhii]MCB8780052.1 DUF6508 domain-containing protein [Planktothrix agardhii 1031]MCF3573540.1 DUF6508 domain-containing protein [Planktothrix agardhii 1805]MCF3587580.1 DUF6508 domain-containing protein [Planktothrix agardhii 1803]MCF3600586.1 DUF6508 domain-containing protein [Planktothrix agardhii 1032]MCF3604866.1 DUF6508 domain-containing protein [Planktothrix agardhii 1804]